MTTLAERREWMRAGCPVEGPMAKIREPMKFALSINPSLRRLVGSCQECGSRREAWGGMEVVPQGLGGTVKGMKVATQAAQRWMIGHARGHGLGLKDARAVYLLEHGRVIAWAREMILNWESVRHGWIGLPGNPDHGFYLFEEPDRRSEKAFV